MKRTILATFDGEVLRPEEPLDLEPNGRYRVTIEEPEPEQAREPDEHPLMKYLEYAVDADLPSDFAEQHDHYLYGTPKR
jgi:hypothetical protein